jgi:hypothetical protein
MNTPKNLTQEPPRSPRIRLGGYAILARVIDKGRATIAGVAGEYRFDCPIDQRLLEFKGVKADDLKTLLATGATDDEVVAWLNVHGTPKTSEEIKAWSAAAEAVSPYSTPEGKKWFPAECAKHGLNPEVASSFDYLEADDAASFKK